ncbi:MAG: hypothetical protein K0R55_3594 [Sporomusa sp.]|jgi:hypothetical protein|nr:hypothetical protein [Sporomusa sp.]
MMEMKNIRFGFSQSYSNQKKCPNWLWGFGVIAVIAAILLI